MASVWVTGSFASLYNIKDVLSHLGQIAVTHGMIPISSILFTQMDKFSVPNKAALAYVSLSGNNLQCLQKDMMTSALITAQ